MEVIKARDPNKLIVFHASSAKDEIRFYINKTQYVSAIDRGDGTAFVNVDEEVESNKENKKSARTIIKENFKEFSIIMGVCILVMAGLMALFFVISSFIRSSMAFLLLLNLTFFIFNIISTVILEIKTTPPALKSKHSAEHMMANFLEKNKRMPKNIEELKKSSRFCMDCGSREMIANTTDEFVAKIAATIMAIAAGSLYLHFFDNNIVYIVIFIGIYILIEILTRMLLKNKLGVITVPIKDALTIFVQCANTTKKVEDKDLILAYYAAEVWMEVVYPEFCDQETEA